MAAEIPPSAGSSPSSPVDHRKLSLSPPSSSSSPPTTGLTVNPSWKTCRFLSILVSAAIVLLLFNVYLLVSLRLNRDPSKSLLGGTLKNTRTWKGSNMRLAVVVPTHAGDLPE
ncbi:unnamed protein product, partial [Laminaria digitata]